LACFCIGNKALVVRAERDNDCGDDGDEDGWAQRNDNSRDTICLDEKRFENCPFCRASVYKIRLF